MERSAHGSTRSEKAALKEFICEAEQFENCRGAATIDPVVELAAVALIGEKRSAPITIAHGSKEASINFIRVWFKTSLLLPRGRWQ
jgi:hypothetical protein